MKHNKGICRLQFSNDGKFVVVMPYDKTKIFYYCGLHHTSPKAIVSVIQFEQQRASQTVCIVNLARLHEQLTWIAQGNT